jgi:hypothetical protein
MESKMADSDETDEIVVVDVKAVARGYRASRLIASEVINDQNEDIGTVDDLIIGDGDRVLFAVLQVGGFLGIGGSLVAVEFESLKLEKVGGALRIVLPGATRDTLKNLPVFNYS